MWHNANVRVVLISTYELGRQPFGLASPAAWLRRAGAEVVALDLSRQRLDDEAVRAADVAAFFLPMHTATRLALFHPWTHRDPRVDALQREVVTIVGRGLAADRQAAFGQVWQRAHEYAGRADPPSAVPLRRSGRRRPPVPYLNEPWYC